MNSEALLAERPTTVSSHVSADGYEQREVVTADGETIIARLFHPAHATKAVALIVPAMAVPQHYYVHFANWLAAQGVLTATFDYRGIGLSRNGHLRDVQADVFDWAELDCAAMVELLTTHAGDKPFYWLGHSLGGQILPLVPNRRHVSRIVTIATGSGYWRENARPARYKTAALWHAIAPITVRLFGYFPGRRLRMVGDLPRGVVTQWRRWCLHADYLVGVEGERVRDLFAAVQTPIVSLSFTDDEYMSARNIESMHSFYTAAPKTMIRLAPADIGGRRIGHFGFFRPAFRTTLWETYLQSALSAPA